MIQYVTILFWLLFTYLHKWFVHVRMPMMLAHSFEDTVGLTFHEAALQIFQAQRHRLRSDAIDTKTILLRVDRRDRMMMTDKPRKLEVPQRQRLFLLLFVPFLCFFNVFFCVFCSSLDVFHLILWDPTFDGFWGRTPYRVWRQPGI